MKDDAEVFGERCVPFDQRAVHPQHCRRRKRRRTRTGASGFLRNKDSGRTELKKRRKRKSIFTRIFLCFADSTSFVRVRSRSVSILWAYFYLYIVISLLHGRSFLSFFFFRGFNFVFLVSRFEKWKNDLHRVIVDKRSGASRVQSPRDGHCLKLRLEISVR